MAKIISIKDGVVLLGNSNNTISEIRVEDCNFTPAVGDEVEVFENEETLICIKKEKEEKQTSGSVNINLVQNQGSNNTGVDSYYATNGKHVVNKVPYILWALLLGGIGAHKFYAGKVGTGFLYLLFFWTYVPAIVAFIEAIVAVCQPADSNGRILV